LHELSGGGTVDFMAEIKGKERSVCGHGVMGGIWQCRQVQ